MGNWGIGTFDNDGACDTLGHVVHDLAKNVEDDLGKLNRRASLERPLLALVAVLAALAHQLEDVRT